MLIWRCLSRSRRSLGINQIGPGVCSPDLSFDVLTELACNLLRVILTEKSEFVQVQICRSQGSFARLPRRAEWMIGLFHPSSQYLVRCTETCRAENVVSMSSTGSKPSRPRHGLAYLLGSRRHAPTHRWEAVLLCSSVLDAVGSRSRSTLCSRVSRRCKCGRSTVPNSRVRLSGSPAESSTGSG
jgi:hypothetical protein